MEDSWRCGRSGLRVTIKQLSDLLQRLTLLPALPHQRLLALRVMDPRSLLHLQHSSDCSGRSVLHPPVESTTQSRHTRRSKPVILTDCPSRFRSRSGRACKGRRPTTEHADFSRNGTTEWRWQVPACTVIQTRRCWPISCRPIERNRAAAPVRFGSRTD